MEIYTVKNQKKLRYGYTTGSCAAGAAAAAACQLLYHKMPETLQLLTPKGISLFLEPELLQAQKDFCICAVRKDSGDDPDVTNGIRILAAVRLQKEGIVITGGEGVGRVTKPGLSCAVGQAAINLGPQAQIREAVQKIAQTCQYTGGFEIVIHAENGAEIAKKTMNAHLGIIGGISILGTSGIVEPMSEQALVDTIHVDLDSHFAAGEREILACPGNYGQDFVQQNFGVDLKTAVITSNFIGETFDYMIAKGFHSILLVGHAGKLIKLAAGVMQTHSAYADGRQEIFAAHAAMLGAPQETIVRIMDCISVDACIDILEERQMTNAVMQSIGNKIAEHAALRTHDMLCTEFIVFTNTRGVLWRSAGAEALLQRIQERTK